LIDALPDSEVHAARRYLQCLAREAGDQSPSTAREGGPAQWMVRASIDDLTISATADSADPVTVALANAPQDDEPSMPTKT
jgi:hypothetical protein